VTFKCFWLFFVVVGLTYVGCQDGKVIKLFLGIREIVGEWVDGGSGLCSLQG